MPNALHFNYAASKEYCESIGLMWLGDDFVRAADMDALIYGFTQKQVDVAMQHHLWQVKWLFDPKNYKFKGRLMLALYFLTGWKPKTKIKQ